MQEKGKPWHYPTSLYIYSGYCGSSRGIILLQLKRLFCNFAKIMGL